MSKLLSKDSVAVKEYSTVAKAVGDLTEAYQYLYNLVDGTPFLLEPILGSRSPLIESPAKFSYEETDAPLSKDLVSIANDLYRVGIKLEEILSAVEL